MAVKITSKRNDYILWHEVIPDPGFFREVV